MGKTLQEEAQSSYSINNDKPANNNSSSKPHVMSTSMVSECPNPSICSRLEKLMKSTKRKRVPVDEARLVTRNACFLLLNHLPRSHRQLPFGVIIRRVVGFVSLSSLPYLECGCPVYVCIGYWIRTADEKRYL